MAYFGGIVALGYFASVIGAPLVIELAKYEITILNKTHADVSNDCALRFSITYETDSLSWW